RLAQHRFTARAVAVVGLFSGLVLALRVTQMRTELRLQRSLDHRLLQRREQRLEVLRAAILLHQLVDEFLLDLLLGHTLLLHSWYDPTHKKSDRPPYVLANQYATWNSS